MASELTSETLIVVTSSNVVGGPPSVSEFIDFFDGYIDPEKIVILEAIGYHDWQRDVLPIAVKDAKNKIQLTSRDYQQLIESVWVDALFPWFHVENHPYFFQGGNLTSNELGDCIIQNSRLARSVPDWVYYYKYKCTGKLIRLPTQRNLGKPQTAGVEHIDERVKFLNNTTVITDDEDYAAVLKQHSYSVYIIPKPEGPSQQESNRTYVNSLILNEKVFVPIFGGTNKEKDKVALTAYKKLLPGKKIIGIYSTDLSDYRKGSIHCLTMTYPRGPLDQSEQILIENPYGNDFPPVATIMKKGMAAE